MGNYETNAGDRKRDAEADAIADLAASGFEVRDEQTGKLHVLVPKGVTLQTFDPPTPILPLHIRQRAVFSTQESFCRYVTRGKLPSAVIFIDRTALSMQAILDYHTSGNDVMPGAHIADWPMPVSLPWQKWSAIDGREIAQAAFAEFLEENVGDVYEPEGAALLEVATNLSGKKSVSFGSGLKLSNGNVQLSYVEDNEAKGGGNGNVQVPEKVVLAIPVFYGGQPYQVPCFFRWRINNGKLSFKIVMQKREQILFERPDKHDARGVPRAAIGSVRRLERCPRFRPVARHPHPSRRFQAA